MNSTTFDYTKGRLKFRRLPCAKVHKVEGKVCQCGASALWFAEVIDCETYIGRLYFCDACRETFRHEHPPRTSKGVKRRFPRDPRNTNINSEASVGNRLTGRNYKF